MIGDNFWSICLKVGLSLGICFQLNSIMVESNSRILSPLLCGIGSRLPDRIWKSISAVSSTAFILFIYYKKEKRERKEFEKRKEKITMLPRNPSCHHFPKNKSIRINIPFHFIFNSNCNICWHSPKYFWCCISWGKSFHIYNLLAYWLNFVFFKKKIIIWQKAKRRKRK